MRTVRNFIREIERNSKAYKALENALIPPAGVDKEDYRKWVIRVLEEFGERSLGDRLKRHTAILKDNVATCFFEGLEGAAYVILLPVTIIMYFVTIPYVIYTHLKNKWIYYIFCKYFKNRRVSTI